MQRMTPSQSPHRCPHVRPFAPDYRTLLCLPFHVPPRAHARRHPTAQDGRRACGKRSREIFRSARAAGGDGGRAHLADDVSSLACHPYAPMLPRLFASPHLASPRLTAPRLTARLSSSSLQCCSLFPCLLCLLPQARRGCDGGQVRGQGRPGVRALFRSARARRTQRGARLSRGRPSAACKGSHPGVARRARPRWQA